MTLRLSRIFLAILMMAFAAARGAMGDDREHENETESNAREAVRAAVERGELKSLAEVLKSVRTRLPGEVLGIEIEREHDIWIYEFRVVDDKDHLFDVYVDAATAQILKTKEK
jgi:uncharacterized membrane protein YkoI